MGGVCGRPAANGEATSPTVAVNNAWDDEYNLATQPRTDSARDGTPGKNTINGAPPPTAPRVSSFGHGVDNKPVDRSRVNAELQELAAQECEEASQQW